MSVTLSSVSIPAEFNFYQSIDMGAGRVRFVGTVNIHIGASPSLTRPCELIAIHGFNGYTVESVLINPEGDE